MSDFTYHLTLTKHTGALIIWMNQRRTVSGTPDQARAFYASVLKHNLALGWWSPISVIVNPIIMFMNWRALQKLEGLIRANQGTTV